MSNTKFVNTNALLLWLFSTVFFLYEFLVRIIIGLYQTPLMLSLDITSFKYSLLSGTSYQIIYGCMQIPAGLTLRKYGVRNVLIFSVIICAIGSILFSQSTSFFTAILARIITAFGSSFGFLCVLMTIYDGIKSNENSFLVGFSQLIGTIGAVTALNLQSITLFSSLGWRSGYQLISVAGLILAAAIFTLTKNLKNDKEQIILKQKITLSETLRDIFSNTQIFYLAIFCAGGYFLLEYLSENEGAIYLQLMGLTPSSSTFLLSIMWMGYAIGCPLTGYLSDKYGLRNKIKIIFVSFFILGIINLLFAATYAHFFISFLLIGLGAGCQCLGFASAAENYKSEDRSVVLGINNFLITVFCAFLNPVLGFLLDYFKNNGLSEFRSIYFTIIFAVSILVFLLIISLFRIKETYCKSNQEFYKLSTNENV